MARRFLIIAALALSGCHLASNLVGAPLEPAQDLAGQVQFPLRSVQADIGDVAKAATVSLINADTNRTESTSVTNDTGGFRLTFPATFKPSATASYYLEAVKGLASNKAGNSAARVRTLAKYQKGWTTLTNAQPLGGIVLNTATTALCIGTSLRSGTATAVDFSALIGTYDADAGTYTPVTNLSGTDFSTLKSLTEQILATDQDPLAGVLLTEPSLWALKNLCVPTIAQLNPTSGGVGTSVTLSGTGFDLHPTNNLVRFNGVPTNVLSATPTALTVSVPNGATPGLVTVQIGAVTATGPTFTVTNLVFGGVLAQN